MSGIRIGIVRRGYGASGGAERYLQRFASALMERGHKPVLFASPEWPDGEGCFVEIRRVAGEDPASFADQLAKGNPWDHCDVLYSFERVWECDFYRAGDGVHQAWLDRRAAGEMAMRKWTRRWNAKHRQILELERHLFSPASKARIVANSEMVKYEIQSYYGKPFEQIRVIYNGYKPPAVAGDPRAAIREQLGFREQDVMLLFSGSGWERKGLRYAIEAANILKSENVKLVVAGRGNQGVMPRGAVRYLGPVKDMPDYYEAADIFILPTLYDPFSNACLEAAAHGLPVVTTLSNGFSEIVNHGVNGDVVAEPWDTPDIVEVIRRWLWVNRRREERDKIRNWARRFHVQDNVQQTLDFLTGS